MSNIAIYADNNTLYSKCDQWQEQEITAKLESDL